MPRKAKDFSKGLIYKLCCKDTSIKEIYVGSTTNFTQRKRHHKSDCNNPNAKQYNYKVYQFIRENGGWFNWNMVLIEYFPCETELELGKKEDYFKNELQARLNSIRPHIYETPKEFYEINKEANKKNRKEYRENNKERTQEYRKEFYENNKKKILEKHKEFYESNKEKIKEYQKQKITCECGSIIRKGYKARHEKSSKHLSILEKRSLLGQGIPEILS